MMRGDSIFTWDKFNDNEEVRKQAMQSAAAGGPNSGFEIPDVDVFKQPELANEFPDMKDDIDLIVSTESYINRLVDFDRRMKKAKGMSRGMAYELLELIPSLESHVKPNHFTEDISGVGLQASLESISGQMWVVIAAAAAFLVAIIYKFTSWLFGSGGGSSGGSGGSLQDAEAGVRDSEKKVGEQEKVLDKTVRKVQDVKSQELTVRMPAQISHDQVRKSTLPESVQQQIIREIPDLLDNTTIDPKLKQEHFLKVNLGEALLGLEGGAQVLEYMKKPSRYARVVFAIQRSKAMELITQSFDGFVTYSKIMMSELDALEEAFNFAKEGQSEFSDYHTKLTSHQKEESSLLSLASMSDERPAAFKFGTQVFSSAAEWAQTLRDQIHEAGSQEPNFNDLEELLVGYHTGVRRLKEVDWRGMITFIELLKKSQPIMAQLEQKAETMRKNAKDTEKFDSAEYRNHAQMVVRLQRSLTENYTGLMRVYAEISRVYTEVTKNAADVVNTLRKNAAGLVALYNKEGEMVPPALEELADELSELSKEASESVVNQHMLPHVSVTHLKVTFGGSDDDDDDAPSISMSAEEAAKSLRIVTGKPE